MIIVAVAVVVAVVVVAVLQPRGIFAAYHHNGVQESCAGV